MMIRVAVLGCMVMAAVAVPVELVMDNDMSELAAIAASVNRNGTTWVAEEPQRFSSLDDVRELCGTWLEGHPNHHPVDVPKYDDHPMFRNVAVPDEFDARLTWPKCSVISKVRDQSSCGSCWAFGSTEAFEDSRCASTGEDIEFSTMDTAGCCKGFLCGLSMGCNGGQPRAALDWMTRTGVVTGGDFPDVGKGTSCKPYTFQGCAHHVPPTSKYPKCPVKEYSVSCEEECTEAKYGKSYESDKTKGTEAFSLETVEAMQKAIATTGPLAVAFTVFSDFPTYKSGVYQHTTGSELGGHAVEMVGWGTEDGTPYWLIKNSWNEEWGDGGFFKIKRGNNECGIEGDVTGIRFA